MNAQIASLPITSFECPLCHTAAPALTETALLAGADWRCAVCHQMWTAQRLATVAAYAQYCVELAAKRAAVPQATAA